MRAFWSVVNAALALFVLFGAFALGYYAGWPWGLALVFGVLFLVMVFALWLWPQARANDREFGVFFMFFCLLLTVGLAYLGYLNYGWPWLRF